LNTVEAGSDNDNLVIEIGRYKMRTELLLETVAAPQSPRASRNVAKLLGTASLVSLSLLTANPALAQDETAATEAASEESVIEVRGIRASIESAQAIKKNADTFVDSVTAEDIGALPDRSVNETLQRIPGVAISRFAASDDPDHFSAEGSSAVVRGLSYVRSELNGRDTFSANNGRALGFNDVSPELLGSVNVFKQQTADMIEGGLAGAIDLRTRKPFDKRSLVLAGSIEGSYGDLRKKWSPSFSLFGSNVWSSGIGDIGLMVNFSDSTLYSRDNGTQIAKYQFRGNGVFTPNPVTGQPAIEGQILVPKGAGVRSRDFDRKRKAFGGALQWESTAGDAKVTAEFLRVEASQEWVERTNESTVDQGYTSNPLAGQSFGFENGIFTNGVLGSPGGAGNGNSLRCTTTLDNCIPGNGFQTTLGKRAVDQDTVTQDMSLNIELHPASNLTITLDGQYVKSSTKNLDFSIFGASFSNVSIDTRGGGIPAVEILAPTADGSRIPNYFADPKHAFYRAAMDHQEDSDGDEFAFRADVKYDFDESNFLRTLRVGGRFAVRDQTTRWSKYNWGAISEVWAGNGGVFLSGFSNASPANSPNNGPLTTPLETYEFPNYQRGSVAQPSNGVYYGGDIIEGYRDGSVIQGINDINSRFAFRNWNPLGTRPGEVAGTVFLPGEINPTKEETFATFARLDFGSEDIFGGMRLAGNIGIRYIKTNFKTSGGFQAPNQSFVPASPCPAVVVTSSPPFCKLSAARQAEAIAFATGAFIPETARSSQDDFLPSFNVKLSVTDDLLFRFGASKGLSRPDLGLARNFFSPVSNLENVNGNTGNFATDPIFRADAGNPALRPVKATNLDLSLEYYPSASTSFTASVFYKKLTDIITQAEYVRNVTNSSGASTNVLITGAQNTGSGTIKGFEIGATKFLDFLPGPLAGFGIQANYTYVLDKGLPNTNLNPTAISGTISDNNGNAVPPGIVNTRLQGLSRNTYNATLVYDKYGISGRLSYNWRSQYLVTTRDVIDPYDPIWADASGQLDASLFYAITPNVKIGVQGANLLNEVTTTRAQINTTGKAGFDSFLLTPRSYFTNDRRLTAAVRFSF
jgi:TonB-dependent receptor